MNIAFTLSTAPLLLLSLLLWRLAKGHLLPVVLFMSVFQAASIFNISFGGTQLGVGPSFFLLLVALIQNIFRRPEPGALLHKPLRSTTALLGIFTVYATLSAFLNPWLFEGTLFTNSKFGSQVPLKWNAGLLPQLIYLLLSILLYYVAAYRTAPVTLSVSIRWYVAGSVLAAVIAVYQFVCMKSGLPFPSEYLHTNPTYGTFEGYEINGFPRMNSTFTEASAAAFFFMSSLSLVLWRVLTGSASPKNIALTFAILVGLLLTISTTGYVGLFYIALVATVVYLRHWKGTARVRTVKLSLAALAGTVFFIFLASSELRGSMGQLLDTVVFTKTSTGSYTERTQWSADAIKTAADTYFLGAGWGVCRASGIIQTLFGNVGILGILCFFAAVIQVFLPIFNSRRHLSQLHGAVLFALSAVFVSLGISGTDLTAQIIWVLLTIASRLAKDERVSMPGNRRIVSPETLTQKARVGILEPSCEYTNGLSYSKMADHLGS